MTVAVGAARIDITPHAPCTLAGYGARDHASEGIHDPLVLRALCARGADGVLAMAISADVLYFFRDAAEGIRAKASAELGMAPSSVFIAGTHTHSAPNARDAKTNAEWVGALVDRAVAAAALAMTRLAPARLRVHRGESRIGINRRERRSDGVVVLGHNPDGPADRELIVVAIDGEDGSPVARIANFACHGVVMGPRNYLVSGDWPGGAAGLLEEELGCPVLFFNGGAGNVNSRIGPQDRFEPVDELAREFARDVRAALDRSGETCDADDDRVCGAEVGIELPRKQKHVDEGKGRLAPVPLQGLRIGGVRLVGYPGEMFTETAMAVKNASARPTLVCSYTGGGHHGYVPVREAYDTGGYEVAVSPYAETAEEILRRGLTDLAARL